MVVLVVQFAQSNRPDPSLRIPTRCCMLSYWVLIGKNQQYVIQARYWAAESSCNLRAIGPCLRGLSSLAALSSHFRIGHGFAREKTSRRIDTAGRMSEHLYEIKGATRRVLHTPIVRRETYPFRLLLGALIDIESRSR